MHELLVETTREILDELETELKTKSKGVWATCFSVIIVLCICIEEIQTAGNGFLMHMRVHQLEDAPSSKDVVEICRKLDDFAFRHMTELFHAIFKTHKYPSPTWRDHVYNPIRDGVQADGDETLRHDSKELVDEVRQIIYDHGTY
jgi:hypothetical protein